MRIPVRRVETPIFFNGGNISKLSGKINEEFFAIAPATFFFIAPGQVGVARVLMLKGAAIPVGTPIPVAVGGLILVKDQGPSVPRRRRLTLRSAPH
jgi:hypothetical protein